jgi:hypothetical protein
MATKYQQLHRMSNANVNQIIKVHLKSFRLNEGTQASYLIISRDQDQDYTTSKKKRKSLHTAELVAMIRRTFQKGI